ncbi:MAG: Ser-Thr-rich glycosyl-phosphatidyl-inositol-anchored rane family [Bacteroidota bacterium]|jgi:hypothetical protein
MMTNNCFTTRDTPYPGGVRIARMVVSLFLTLIPVIVWADVSVRAPHASTVYAPGTPLTIEWTDDLEAPRVTVEVWDGQRQTTTVIANDVAAPQRSVNWTVPDNMSTGTRYRFVVRDARRRHRAVFSPGFYTVAPLAPTLTSATEPDVDMSELSIMPTPAGERAVVSWAEPVTIISVVNIHGEEVRTIRPTGEASTCSVNVEDLAPGTYSVNAQALSQKVLRSQLIIYR